MVFAWGLLAPLGIMLALYYKVVWPNGQWFYVRIICSYEQASLENRIFKLEYIMVVLL